MLFMTYIAPENYLLRTQADSPIVLRGRLLGVGGQSEMAEKETNESVTLINDY